MLLQTRRRFKILSKCLPKYLPSLPVEIILMIIKHEQLSCDTSVEKPESLSSYRGLILWTCSDAYYLHNRYAHCYQYALYVKGEIEETSYDLFAMYAKVKSIPEKVKYMLEDLKYLKSEYLVHILENEYNIHVAIMLDGKHVDVTGLVGEFLELDEFVRESLK